MLLPQMYSRHMRTPGACRCGSNEVILVFSSSTLYASSRWLASSAHVDIDAVAQAAARVLYGRLIVLREELEPKQEVSLGIAAIGVDVRRIEYQHSNWP